MWGSGSSVFSFWPSERTLAKVKLSSIVTQKKRMGMICSPQSVMYQCWKTCSTQSGAFAVGDSVKIGGSSSHPNKNRAGKGILASSKQEFPSFNFPRSLNTERTYPNAWASFCKTFY